jgi:microcystin-dependent protein
MIKRLLIIINLLIVAFSYASAIGESWKGVYEVDPRNQSISQYTTSLQNMNNNIWYNYKHSGGDTSVNIPVGAILMWGSSNIPEGWLELNGQAIDATEYPELASLYGLNLPDFRGYFPRAEGTNSDGTQSGTLIQKQTFSTAMPTNKFITEEAGEHTHQYTYEIYNILAPFGNDNRVAWEGIKTETKNTSAAGNHTHTISGGDSETRPKNIAVKFIIKAK